jgi:hypothetical protein
VFGLFSNSAAASQQPRSWEGARAPGTQIRFDPDLVDNLSAEHHALLTACEELEIACAKARVAQVVSRLRALEEQIGRHRVQEDVKLMIFIEKHNAERDGVAALLALIRRERDLVRKQLSETIKKYALPENAKAPAQEISRDVGEVIHLIARLIDREENDLFPLYVPNNAAGEGGYSAELMG